MKRTPAAQVRRRRLATTVGVLVVLSAGVVLATQLPAHSHANDPHSPSPTTTPASTSTSSAAQLQTAIRSYVKQRDGAISVAVYDNVAQHLLVVHPTLRGRTASIVKADILETLLHRTNGHLSESQRETATAMIENSDNDSATDLWDEDGGGPGVTAYNDDLGLTQTTTNVDWGLTTTSAADQVRLVRELFSHSPLLTSSGRRFERGLMRHVEADQRWGISGGVPKDATFGNKNGWLPVDEDHDRWAVNSIGWVRGEGKRYEIAVITQHNMTEAYGIHSIQHVAKLVWSHMTVDPSTAS